MIEILATLEARKPPKPLTRKQRLKLIKQIARRRGMLKTQRQHAPTNKTMEVTRNESNFSR